MSTVFHQYGRALSIVLAATAALVLAAPAKAAGQCNPVALETCALPFPSNAFTLVDGTTSTGLRVDVRDDLAPSEILAGIPPNVHLTKIFRNSDGFSAASAAAFELSAAPDVKKLAVDGKNQVLAYEIGSGEAAPIRVQISNTAQDKRLAEQDHVLEITPRSRWKYGKTYIVAIKSSLPTVDGVPMKRSTGFSQAILHDGNNIAQAYASGFAVLEQNGVRREDLLAATVFTVRSEANVTMPLRTVMKDVLAADHPVRNIKVTYLPTGSIGAVVAGELLSKDYRHDSLVVYDSSKALDQWLHFIMFIPRSAGKTPAKVAIFGHTIITAKELAITLARSNADRGIATIAIDQPNHGSRIRSDGGFTIFRARLKYTPLQIGMLTESPIDQMAVYQAIKTSLAKIDVLPRVKGQGDKKGGDGIPDINPDRVIFEGTSLGGVLGSTFVSLAPKLDGAYLYVTGVGVMNILSNSVLWDWVYRYMMPENATGSLAVFYKTALQQEIDYADGINFIHYMRNPPEGIAAKPVVITVGIGDIVVPTFSSQAFAEIADLPIVGKKLFNMPNVREVADFENGYGLVQMRPVLVTGLKPPYQIDQILAHFSFLRVDAYRSLHSWLDEVVVPLQ